MTVCEAGYFRVFADRSWSQTDEDGASQSRRLHAEHRRRALQLQRDCGLMLNCERYFLWHGAQMMIPTPRLRKGFVAAIAGVALLGGAIAKDIPTTLPRDQSPGSTANQKAGANQTDSANVPSVRSLHISDVT